MRKFWFKFDLSIDQRPPIGVLIGVGVTALNQEDAIELIRKGIFDKHDFQFPRIEFCKEDIELKDLDKDHVITNMGNWDIEGVWFPLGYNSDKE